ncbi:MAG: hypothetical protein ACLS54_10875, partial [Anaerostipes hadrus]
MRIVYHWPFSNVSSKNGSVCYGNNNIRKIEKLSDLDILPIIVFDSALNGDYYYSEGQHEVLLVQGLCNLLTLAIH